jgi:hypothetical protein
VLARQRISGAVGGYLQSAEFFQWAMLGSNQQHLPYESSVMVC